MNPSPTAAVLVIGDEILSGRTQDTNTNYIAKFLGALGIDLTHDDITADAVAKAFGVGIDYHPEALAMLAARYANPADFNDMSKRMARIPLTASLVKNTASTAPGFQIGNV